MSRARPDPSGMSGSNGRTDYQSDPRLKGILEKTDQLAEADRLLTARQLADKWQLPSEKSVYRMAREGYLPDGPGGVVIRLGKRVRFSLEGVLRFEAQGGTDQ